MLRSAARSEAYSATQRARLPRRPLHHFTTRLASCILHLVDTNRCGLHQSAGVSTEPRAAQSLERSGLRKEAGRRGRALHESPERAVVFSFDEKTQVQALDRTQPSLPIKPGRGGTITHDYKRHGTTDLFAAMNERMPRFLLKFSGGHSVFRLLPDRTLRA